MQNQNENRIDIACVGILVADVLAKPVDHLPEKGLLQLVDSIELFTGGNAMTAALNISKIGFSSAVCGKVGNDFWGAFLRERLSEQGVSTNGLKMDAHKQTSVSVALSAADGERTFLHCPGANAAFTLDDVDWSVIERSSTVFVTGTFLLGAFDGAQTAEFLKRCRNMGKITALDVCWDSTGRWSALLDDAMPYIDYFMPSVDEARLIAKRDGVREMAAEFFRKGAGSVIIKMGAEGCYAQQSPSSEGRFVPACGHVVPIDTTGAGDSFCAGFLSALTHGDSFWESVRFANAAGAHCVMEKGATTGMKSYAEIRRFLDEQA